MGAFLFHRVGNGDVEKFFSFFFSFFHIKALILNDTTSIFS